MMFSRITFKAIQTTDILYFDSSIAKTCLRFCHERNLDCLPSLDNPSKFYRRDETGFCEEDVTADRSVDEEEFIFDPSLLERFRKNHLQFVFLNKDIQGVVHFSDYNRPAVNAFLFDLLSSYERSLRKLLVLSHLTNQDMLDFFLHVADHSKKPETRSIYLKASDDYQERRGENDRLPAFERFYLQNLIGLAAHRGIIKVHEEVSRLRNDVMHAHEFVNMQDASRDDYIYDFKSFERFWGLVSTLIYDDKLVHNRIAFLTLVEGK